MVTFIYTEVTMSLHKLGLKVVVLTKKITVTVPIQIFITKVCISQNTTEASMITSLSIMFLLFVTTTFISYHIFTLM